MYYHALATDYDGTLATDGRVDEQTRAALERLRGSGRRLIMVTGRELDDLERVFPHLDLFDLIVAENGALLYRPEAREEIPLGPPPPPRFVETLRERGVDRVSAGRVIVATWEPHETTVLEAIRELGLELEIIFNKGAVMVLPAGVNKASGLVAALRELGLSPHNVVGAGDAENDHAFLRLCGCGVAVANALPALKEEADIVTEGARSAGVRELIDRLLADDLDSLRPGAWRHRVLLGRDADGGRDVYLSPRSAGLLLAGTSGSGKSSLTTGLLERLGDRGYQFCILDPEGDYEAFEGAVTVGDARQPPSAAQAMQLLERPDQNVAVNMLAIPLGDRPAFFGELLADLQQLRTRTGRPHWIVVDEAHHMLPRDWRPAPSALPREIDGLMLVTVHPDSVSPAALAAVDTVIALGERPDRTIRSFCERAGREPPPVAPGDLPPGEALLWHCRTDGDAGAAAGPVRFRVEGPRGERRRHVRKYAEGELAEKNSFYFRGPDGRLNLRAQNLHLFLQIAAGVDDETWLHHLRAGDYSRWVRDKIKDGELADEIAAVEREAGSDPAGSREKIREAIERRYTAPA